MKQGASFFLLCIILACNSSWGQALPARLLGVSAMLDSLANGSMPGLASKVRMDVSDTPVSEFIGLLSKSSNLNLNVAPDISLSISNRFSDASVKDILLFLCVTYQLDIEHVQSILLIKPYKKPIEPLVSYKEKPLSIYYDSISDLLSFNLKNDSIALFAKQLTERFGRNILVSSAVRNARITGFISSMPFKRALETVAATNSLVLKTSNDHLMFDISEDAGKAKAKGEPTTPRGAAQGKPLLDVKVVPRGNVNYVSVDARQAPLDELIHEISRKLDLGFYIFSAPDQLVTAQFNELSFEEVLSKLLTPTDHTFKFSDGVYLIGPRSMEGLRSSKVYKLKFRSVEEIDKVIPQELKKDIQLTVFSELNAIILTGSAPQINEITSLLQSIDEPVPNILIEVIVVDFRKGYTIETGINAILSDSSVAPKSSGRVFPGIDVTLGTNLITNLFQRANIVNLGEITPRLYVTLKALESNNNITIRSTPKLSTLNGHPAELSIGQSVFYVQETQVITPGVTPITRVTKEFHNVEANLKIAIKPIVSGNEHITLTINAEFSNFVPAEIEGAPPGSASRQFNSMIRIRNGEMIVLGGLEEVSRSETNSGVPLLSRIPILKWLFSSKEKTKKDDRLVVFIKPVIVF